MTAVVRRRPGQKELEKRAEKAMGGGGRFQRDRRGGADLVDRLPVGGAARPVGCTGDGRLRVDFCDLLGNRPLGARVEPETGRTARSPVSPEELRGGGAGRIE